MRRGERRAPGRVTDFSVATRAAPALVRDEAARRGVGIDAVALAAALAQPFVHVVLSRTPLRWNS